MEDNVDQDGDKADPDDGDGLKGEMGQSSQVIER